MKRQNVDRVGSSIIEEGKCVPKDQEVNKVLCFVSDEMADFEITLVVHIMS